jgi:hypothetical protein
MKNVNSFLVGITLFLWGWQTTAQAQGGADRSTAVAVAIGNTMPEARILTNGAEQWFSFTATAGATYLIENCGYSGIDTEVQVFYESNISYSFRDDDGCGSGVSSSLVVTADQGGTYYILWRNLNGDNGTGSFNWTLTEAIDNRVCANAEAVELNTPVLAVSGQNRWYQLAATAGTSYEIAGGNCSFYVFSSCGGGAIAGGSGQVIFTAPAAQNYYIRE